MLASPKKGFEMEKQEENAIALASYMAHAGRPREEEKDEFLLGNGSNQRCRDDLSLPLSSHSVKQGPNSVHTSSVFCSFVIPVKIIYNLK